MNPLRFTRRNLLRGSLAATAVFPLLEAPRAHGQNGVAPRASSCSRRRTARATRCSGRRASRRNFTLNTFTQSLEPYKTKLTFLKGIRLNDALQNGSLGGNARLGARARHGRHADRPPAQRRHGVQELRQHDVRLG